MPERRPHFYVDHIAWTKIIIEDSDGEVVRLTCDGTGIYSVHRRDKKGDKPFSVPVDAEIVVTNPNDQIFKVNEWKS